MGRAIGHVIPALPPTSLPDLGWYPPDAAIYGEREAGDEGRDRSVGMSRAPNRSLRVTLDVPDSGRIRRDGLPGGTAPTPDGPSRMRSIA